MVTFHSMLVGALTALAMASPIAGPGNSISVRQPMDSNDLQNEQCKDVTFIFARGSTEMGNMGTLIGPPACSGLKSLLGADKVACQGVGGMYTAGLVQNTLPQNTDPGAIITAKELFNQAAEKCPNTKIVAGGYSQGSAVIDNAVQALSEDVKSKIKGVVLFGFTRNQQDDGRIPNYPKDLVKVFCAVGDMVCSGTLIITPAHLTYGIDADKAASFLKSKLEF